MPDSLPTVWPLKPHTRAKHEILVRYLGAWFPVLGRWRGRVIFLDGFAGPGVYDGGEAGSPAHALTTLLDHRHLPNMAGCEYLFLFNEQDEDRFRSLESVVAELKAGRGESWPKNIKVMLTNQNFTQVAGEILGSIGTGKLAPTFAFLDPFGYRDVPMDLIRRLLAFDKSELFIYFDYNSVSRFATAGNVDGHFEALFGTDEFKNAPPAGDPGRKPFLHDLYQKQLEQICQFDYVQSFEMVNGNNRTGNYLFFCTRSLKGLDAMKQAMWKIAPGGDFRFSDLLDGQSILFVDDVDTQPLRRALAAHFQGREVPIQEVIDFTVGHTPFTSSHVKVKTLKPMQQDGEVFSPNQRRAGTFPDGTIVGFR